MSKVTPVVAFKISPRHVSGKPYSKVCRQARIAANHWVLVRGAVWWRTTGWKLPRPQAYDVMRKRDAKMYRRILPIFKKILP